MKSFKQYNEVRLDESDARMMARFQKAVQARDAEVTIKMSSVDPMAKGAYQIQVYSASTDKSTVYIADVISFRGNYMS